MQKVSCCVYSSKIVSQIIKNTYRRASVMNPDFKSLYKSAHVCVWGGEGVYDTTQRHSSGIQYSRDNKKSHVSVWQWEEHTLMGIPGHKTSSWSPSNLCLQVLDWSGFRMTHIFMQNGKPRCFTSHKIFHKMSILQYFCNLIITHIWTKQLSVVYCKKKKL